MPVAGKLFHTLLPVLMSPKMLFFETELAEIRKDIVVHLMHTAHASVPGNDHINIERQISAWACFQFLYHRSTRAYREVLGYRQWG